VGGSEMLNNEDLDIMGNIKLIENYKNFLLSTVADLFVTMGKGSKASMDEVNDELAEIMIFSYLLGKRLGINYSSLDERMIKKLKLGAALEENNIDYSKLISYIKDGREI
jgi:hypothetical protein